MTTTTIAHTDFILPKTEAALEHAHIALRDLQRTLAERLLAEQETYLALDRDFQTLKKECQALRDRLAQPEHKENKTKQNQVPVVLLQKQVEEALGMLDRALLLFTPSLTQPMEDPQ